MEPYTEALEHPKNLHNLKYASKIQMKIHYSSIHAFIVTLIIYLRGLMDCNRCLQAGIAGSIPAENVFFLKITT